MQSAEPYFARSPASARAPYLFALGKAWDDLGEADRAFAAFDEGARLTSAERPYAAEQDKAAAERLVGNVAPAWMASAAVDASAPSKPIFVTGIPRSGTTLVEQMLTSHSQVSNGGELNLMAAAAAPLGALDLDSLRRTYDAAGSPAPWAAVRELYLHLVTERFGSDGRIVDKTLNASRFAALVRLAFPEAPVIWLRRDPLDTAWSCFRTYFVTGAPWSFSLADIGRYMAVEDFLFERWQAVFGDQMMVLPYRDLVEDSETWIPAMLGHASLPSEAGVFAFNATERAVTTSSVAQVREPLYQRGLGSSAPYRAYLQPFMQAYEAARAQLGLRSAQS